jgi:hypothetical protein
MSSTATTLGLIVLLFGLAFAGIGLAISTAAGRFRRGAQRAQATVQELNMAPSGTYASTGMNSGPVYRPVVTFTTADGRVVRAESRVGTNPAPAKVGETVAIFYDPSNPERIQLDTAAGRRGCLGWAFVALGGGIAAIGVVILIAAG